MIFNSAIFFWFFAVFFLLFNFVFVEYRKQLWLLLVSSLIFYGTWNYKFIGLIVFSAAVDYLIAHQVEKNTDSRIRKSWLLLSITVNLSVLAIFKYNNFVLQSVQSFVQLLGGDVSVPTLSIVLPVGISFYTFQSMSYTIDVYRGDMKAHRGFLQFLTALSFFPQLVAGPILRAKYILPQLVTMPVPTAIHVRQGLLLVILGLLKKTVADLMAGPVAYAFDSPGDISTLELWIGLLAFSVQVYGDFSGYSDIAIGLALMLGFHIPANFNLPYFSTSPAEFWRRWHISLSSWLRDYLYISLGGSRNGKQARNLLITMTLAGLWHGAAWTFVLWGIYMGLLIIGTQWMQYNTTIGARLSQTTNKSVTLFKIVFTHFLFVTSWPLFRGTSLENAWLMIKNSFIPQSIEAPGGAGLVMLLVCAALLITHFLDALRIHYGDVLVKRQWMFWPILVVGFSLFFMIGDTGHDFIYFQF